VSSPSDCTIQERSKVLLWDIDGTLLRTPGVGVRAFARALETVAGTPMARVTYDFGGKTDPLIARDLLAAVGIDDEAYVPLLLAEVERNYDGFADDLRSSIVTLPGTAELLDRCAALLAVQTVVTGNIQFVARRKLEAADMHHHLDLDRGGFGSDHHDRTELVRIALARLAERDGAAIDPERVWIIGDTPRDAACARGAGVHCLLVATGTYSMDALGGLGAQQVLSDLSDVELVLDILMS
jgi:phosphoglycolate phosphatase-like HAD superfamily hydrolase